MKNKDALEAFDNLYAIRDDIDEDNWRYTRKLIAAALQGPYKLNVHIVLGTLFRAAKGKKLDPETCQTIEQIVKEYDYYDVEPEDIQALYDCGYSQPQDIDLEALCKKVVDTVLGHSLQNAVFEDMPDTPYALIDALSCSDSTVKHGQEEAEFLADHINGVIIDHLHKRGLIPPLPHIEGLEEAVETLEPHCDGDLTEEMEICIKAAKEYAERMSDE